MDTFSANMSVSEFTGIVSEFLRHAPQETVETSRGQALRRRQTYPVLMGAQTELEFSELVYAKPESPISLIASRAEYGIRLTGSDQPEDNRIAIARRVLAVKGLSLLERTQVTAEGEQRAPNPDDADLFNTAMRLAVTARIEDLVA